LRVHRGFAYLLESQATARDWRLSWNSEDSIALPQGMGSLSFRRTAGAGISLARLAEDNVIVRNRCGGERIQPDCARPRRTLKNLLQEAAVPPWRRFRLPLLFCGDQLVWAPEIGIDCTFQARNGEPGLAVTWRTRS
jgi:tRNA(Ile)-lysidine synthase